MEQPSTTLVPGLDLSQDDSRVDFKVVSNRDKRFGHNKFIDDIIKEVEGLHENLEDGPSFAKETYPNKEKMKQFYSRN